MKKYLKRLTALILALLMVSTLTVGAVETDATETRTGNGTYTVEVYNGSETGISIDGDWFHAYQIFSASNATTYAVTDAFKGFFVGTMTAGDGTNKPFDFASQLDLMDSADPEVAEDATHEYNQMAGLYMESYTNDQYALATQLRNYLNANGAYNGGTVECVAHSQAVATSSYEIATLEGLEIGYYFIMDQESTMNGLGIASSGAFVAISSTSNNITTVKVKDSFPIVEKYICHDELGAGDVVGDHQIGDTVNFLLMSTLPSNISEYTTYTYTLTDEMTAGLTYDGNAALYTDNTYTTPIDSQYWSVESSGNGFKLTVDVKSLMADDTAIGVVYTHYTATLNSDAVVAPEADENTVTLEYSNNPNNSSETGTSEDTVFHYTFSLDVNKVDEALNPLAGATFALYDDDGMIKLSYKETDDNGVDYYYPNAAEVGDGTIVTSDSGLFQIYGLNDAKTYTLKEIAAPEGYNAMDDMSFTFTAEYNSIGTAIISLDDDNASIETTVDNGDVSSTTTIINRKTILLPSTGGMGTMIFQIGGGVLMVGAATALLLSKRKKSK